MLYEFFNSGGHLKDANIHETFEKLTVTLNPKSPMKEFISKLFDELKTLSKRDSFELFFTIEGDDVSISGIDPLSFNVLSDHIDANDASDNYDISLIVTKNKKDTTISIYFLDHFGTYICSESSSNIISTLHRIFVEKIQFEVFSTINSSCSTGFSFFQAGQCSEFNSYLSKDDRARQLELFSDYTTSHNFKLNVVPSDFNLHPAPENKIIFKFFSEYRSLLSIMFLANTSSLELNNFSCKIFGYKTICSKIEMPYSFKDEAEILYAIYKWCYEEGANSDKIGLVRNILSIHLDKFDNIRFDKSLWDSIRSNYQVYLRGNIQSYLEIKSKISDYLIDFNSKTHSIVDELLGSMKANFLIVSTYLLTVVLVDGIKDNGAGVVFSKAYLNIVGIISIISLLWIFFTRREAKNRFDSSSKSIKDVVRSNYEKLILSNEIDDSIDPIVNKNKEHLDLNVEKYSWWWFFIVVIFFILYYSSVIVLSA